MAKTKTPNALVELVRQGTDCPYCGERYELEVLEWWPEDRAWIHTTCCEDAYEEAAYEMEHWSRQEWAEWFQFSTGGSIRQVYSDLGCYQLDYGLELCEVTLAEAQAFIARHHAHNVAPRGWKWGAGLRNGSELVAVLVVGRPVARLLDDGTVVEVTRLCVDRTLPSELTWNACSQLYGAAVREARKRGFAKVITYTLETEAGTTLQAAGFAAVAKTRGGSWSRSGRPRTDKAPTCRKVRWERLAA